MKFYNLLLKKSGTHTVFLIIPNAVTRTIKDKLNVMLSCCIPCLPLSCTYDIVVFFFFIVFLFCSHNLCACVRVCVCVCVSVCVCVTQMSVFFLLPSLPWKSIFFITNLTVHKEK